MRLELAYTPPLPMAALLEFLAFRAVPGIEELTDGRYRRVLQVGSHMGVLALGFGAGAPVVEVDLDDALAPAAGVLAEGVARVLDLDADVTEIDALLSGDPLLRPLVQGRPGMRVAGAFDGFEMAVRAVIGQQISVAGARTVTARLADRFGDPLDEPSGSLRVAFPRPAAMVAAPSEGLGMPTARGATLVGLARAICEGRLDLAPGGDVLAAREVLLALPGVGPWTAEYIAMRALGDRDAFPASDLVLRQILGRGAVVTTREAEQRSQRWRPWRAYAVVHLWAASAELRLARD